MDRCKQTVYRSGSMLGSQCSRKAVRDGYCKQHHPNEVAARRKKSREREPQDYISKRFRQYEQRIEELEGENKALRNQIAVIAHREAERKLEDG